MAIEFADMIVPITISNEVVSAETTPPGQVLPAHILYKSDEKLCLENGEPVEAPIEFLENLIFNTPSDVQ